MKIFRNLELVWNAVRIGFQNIYRFSYALGVIWVVGLVCYLGAVIDQPAFRLKYVLRTCWRRIVDSGNPTHARHLTGIGAWFWDHFASAMGFTTILTLVAGAIMITIAQRFGGHLFKEKLLRGTELVSKNSLTREVRSQMLKEIAEIKADNRNAPQTVPSLSQFVGKPFSPTACRFEVPEVYLSRHMVALGASGTGKSTLIKHKIEHSYATSRKGIVLDFNGELYRALGREDDVVLSLFDTRTHYWDPYVEAERSQTFHPSDIATYLVPKGNDQNRFFWNGARQVLRDLLNSSSSLEELTEKLVQSPDKLRKILEPSTRYILGNPSSGQEAGILGTALQDIEFLKYLNHWPRHFGARRDDAFSMSEWVANDDDTRWVYLTASTSDLDITRPILRLWFNIAIHGILHRDPAKDNRPISIIIDELAALGNIETLPKVINMARKYGGEAFLGLQSESQLESIYGLNTAHELQNGLQTKWIFRTPHPKAAAYLSDVLGRKELNQINKSTSYGASNFNDRETLGETVTERNAVLPTEIALLETGHLYLKLPGASPYKTRLLKKSWDTEARKSFQTYFEAARKPDLDHGKNSPSKVAGTPATEDQGHQTVEGEGAIKRPEQLVDRNFVTGIAITDTSGSTPRPDPKNRESATYGPDFEPEDCEPNIDNNFDLY